jgi:hypothetical protein
MGLRRLRGVGCLGCLPFGGLLGLFFPLILIGALIYFLVNRQKAVPGPPDNAPPQGSAAGFCPQCGKPVPAGARFCAACGRQID